MIVLKGIGVSSGREMGKVYKIANVVFRPSNRKIRASQCREERELLQNALELTIQDMEKILEKNSQNTPLGDIIQSRIDILQDPVLKGRMGELITDKMICAIDALYIATEEFAQQMDTLEDPYMRERAADIRDVAKNVYGHLMGIPTVELTERAIVVAEDLTASTLCSLNRNLIQAIISGTGGKTSHVAILANGMGIPAIAGVGNDIRKIKDGETVILNGKNGNIYIDPDEKILSAYNRAQKKEKIRAESRARYINRPGVTRDGQHQVMVCANIAFPDECHNALAVGAEGIGLYRTEFLYMDTGKWPNEEEQYKAYDQVREQMAPAPVTIRTLDSGGDKTLSYLNLPQEANPFLGLRAVRVSLAYPAMFKRQLRALLRASAGGGIKIMFPMISNLTELRQACGYLEECKVELAEEGIPFDENIQVGVMVEVPAAAVMAEELAPEVDFFSIGTNDLIQYTMAADRLNEGVAHLYDHCQPAILRLIKMTVDAAHKYGKPVGICGQMAEAKNASKLLVGLGLDEFSMAPRSILRFKSRLTEFTYEEAVALAEKALECGTAEEVHRLIGI